MEGVIDPDIEYAADGVTFVDNPYGDVLVIENLSVTDGTLTGPDDDGNYSYTPDPNFEGIASFNYGIKERTGKFPYEHVIKREKQKIVNKVAAVEKTVIETSEEIKLKINQSSKKVLDLKKQTEYNLCTQLP